MIIANSLYFQLSVGIRMLINWFMVFVEQIILRAIKAFIPTYKRGFRYFIAPTDKGYPAPRLVKFDREVFCVKFMLQISL